MGALVLVVALLAAHPTEASSFVFFTVGCNGNQATLDACGCSNVPSNTHGGYTFTNNGQSAAAYNQDGCTGVASTRFSGSNTGQCSGVGWKSVFIQC